MKDQAEGPVPGGAGRRFVARVTDVGVLAVLAYLPTTRGPRLPEYVIGYVGFIFRLGIRTNDLIGFDRIVLARLSAALGLLLSSLAYFILCEERGQTIGKRMVGVRVVRADGGPFVSYGQALGRTLTGVITAIPLGLGQLAMLWDAQRRTWPDLMTATRVVRVGWNGQVDSLARPVVMTVIVTLIFSVVVPFALLVAPLNTILGL